LGLGLTLILERRRLARLHVEQCLGLNEYGGLGIPIGSPALERSRFARLHVEQCLGLDTNCGSGIAKGPLALARLRFARLHVEQDLDANEGLGIASAAITSVREILFNEQATIWGVPPYHGLAR
jgi:hypothetical protein